MTTTDAFKDKKLIIYINDSDNKMTIPLNNAKGNIGNVINFILYACMNSGMEWQDIYTELSNFIHHKVDDIEFEQGIKQTVKKDFLEKIMTTENEC